jgi:hypothetical protein
LVNFDLRYCPQCLAKLFIREEFKKRLIEILQEHEMDRELFLEKAEELLLCENAPFELLMDIRFAIKTVNANRNNLIAKALETIGHDKLCFTCGYSNAEIEVLKPVLKSRFSLRSFFLKAQQKNI